MDGLLEVVLGGVLQFLFHYTFLSIPVWVWMCVLAGLGILVWAIL